jgi:hypothetical protein
MADGSLRRLETEELEQRLRRLPETLAASARRLSTFGAWVETPGGTLLLGHQPEIAPVKYAICIYPPLPGEAVEVYRAQRGFDMPTSFREFLSCLNGLNFFELSIYGIPPSMLGETPLLSRSSRSPLDIGTAALAWWAGFPLAIGHDFLFGSRNIGWNTQVGYFIRSDGSVVGYQKGQEDPDLALHGVWSNFEEWFGKELVAAEADVETQRLDVSERSAARSWAPKRNLLQSLLRQLAGKLIK